jgi:hypothetical protein
LNYSIFRLFSDIKVTLTGAEEKMNECCKAAQDYVNRCVLTVECEEFPLHSWDQTTINIFYEYSFEQHVIPEVDSINEKLKLSGPTDKVMETKTEYYRMKSIKAEDARVASYARIAVWVYEMSNGNVEKYSLKLNALIEEAFSKNVDSVRII